MDGCYSLREAADLTGYNYKQLLRARGELKQHWAKNRRGKPRLYRITEAQLQKLIEHLGRPFTFVSRKKIPSHRWSNKWERCRRCNRNGNAPGRKHAGKGYCESCHTVLRRNPNAKLRGLHVRATVSAQEARDGVSHPPHGSDT